MKEGKVVSALQERPILFPELQMEWDAFVVLNRARDFGFAEGPIKISEIDAYCRFNEIRDLDYKKKLLRRISLMDIEYLKLKAEKKQ
jgi:hypothetical protein